MKRPGRVALVAAGIVLSACPLLWTALHLRIVPVSGGTAEALYRWDRRPYSLDIRDRHGTGLATVRPTESPRREYLSAHEVPALLVDILIASEDRRFFSHPGVDPIAVARSALINMRTRRSASGASTITMQLARMVKPHRGGLSGKIRELWTALELETRLSKQEILERWLNSLPFGSNVEGVASGSQLIFSRPVHQLTAAEMVLLAVVPRNPSALHPARNPKSAVAAATRLAHRSSIPITPEQLQNALPDVAGTKMPHPSENPAPHFVQAVIRSIEPERWKTGAPLVTSLDADMQHHLVNALVSGVREASDRRIAHAAALVIDNASGEIRAWVGSISPTGTAQGDQIDGVRVRNPSGSTLKPFLYALALDRGYDRNSMLPDRRMQFGDEDAYLPVNFNRRYSGRVPLSTALASSLNVPAVYLADQLGVEPFANLLAELGFEDSVQRGPLLGHGIAVGNAEVSLLELVRAFSIFPRGGTIVKPSMLPRGPQAGQASSLSDTSVRLVAQILGDPHDRAPGFGVSSRLSTPFPAMFKTGTANQHSDIWAVGATPALTAGVWMGNHKGRTITGQTGSTLPASILVEFFSRYLEANERFSTPGSPDRSMRSTAQVADVSLHFPGNGAVFVFDPRLSAADQGVPIEAKSSEGTDVSIRINGSEIARGNGRMRHLAALDRGDHLIELVTTGGVAASAHIEVR